MPTILADAKITVVRPQGTLNATNAVEFQRQIIAVVAQERQNVFVVDMEQVESLDSAGLMALVSGLRLAQALEQRFSLCCVCDSIRMIFELTQLDQVFEVYESVAALESSLKMHNSVRYC